MAQAIYALLKVGLLAERGNTLECRRKFLLGCREAPKSARPAAYATIANPALDGCISTVDDVP